MSEDFKNISWPGWEIVRLIGRGSFGAVYEIKRKVFDETEKAALKVISIPQNSGDIDDMYSDGYDEESITSTFKSHLQSIVAEYSLMRKMNGSANIVNCDDVRYIQHDDGIGWDIFIKMELLTPLTKALSGEVDEKTVVKIAKDMCGALELCKKHGIVHRDIKPQNIFVSEHGDYKLGDFGIAKTVEKTMGGTKIGTYKYMAPEVYNNQPYGSGADIYSLGLVLYWLLNERRMPFMPLPPEKLKAGVEENSRHRRLSGEKLPEPAHGSKQLKQIVLKACAYDPKDRYFSAAAMLEDLSKLTEGTSVTPSVIIPDFKDDENRRMTRQQGPVSNTTKKAKVDNVVTDDSDATIGPPFNVKISAVVHPKEEKAKTTEVCVKEEKQKTNTLKCLFVVFGVVIAMVLFLLLRSCDENQSIDKSMQTTQPQQTIECIHLWVNANCTNPLTCSLCGESSGTPNGHKWKEATCTSSATCIICDEKRGSPKGHSWIAATTDTPKTCIICNQTDGVPLAKIISIDSSAYTIVVLKSDGTVNAIGARSYGRLDVAKWQNIVAIAAGSMHTVGVKKDGSVVAVGYNEDGQCNVSDWTNITAVSASGSHTVGLKSDGTVVATGSNLYGECNVSGWSNIIAVSTGEQNTVGVKSDGTIVFAGRGVHDNFNGLSEWNNITSVVATQRTTIGLRSDGTVIATGYNVDGQCDVSHWSNIIAIAADEWHTIGLRADGTVVVAGSNEWGQLSKVNDWKNIVAVSAGFGHTACLLSDGTVVSSGKNGGGEWDLSELN